MVAFFKILPILENRKADLNIDGFNNVIRENFGSRASFEVLNLNSLMKNLEVIGSYIGTKSTSMIIPASPSYVIVRVALFVKTIVTFEE